MIPYIKQTKNHNEVVEAITYFETSLTPSLLQRGIVISDLAKKLISNGVVFLALSDCQWVGILAGYMNDHTEGYAYVSIIAVDKEFRGLGFGKQLLTHAEEQALMCGMSKVRLEVRQYNLSAINFYSHLGYRIDGNASDDSFYMSKNL